MWPFKKKEKPKPVEVKVSAKELVCLIDLAIKAIDDFQIEYDLEFTQDGEKHTIGIGYDRDSAPKKGYFPEYMSVFLDNQSFNDLQELADYAQLGGTKFIDFEHVFVVDPYYKEVLETGIIDGGASSIWYGERSHY